MDDDGAPVFGTVEDIADGEDDDILQQQQEEEEESDDEFGDIISSQQEIKTKGNVTDKKKEVAKSPKNNQKGVEKTPVKKDKGKGKKKAKKQGGDNKSNSSDSESVASSDSDEEEEEKSSKGKQASHIKPTTPKKQGSSSQTKISSPPKEGMLKKPAPQKRDQPAAKSSPEVCVTVSFHLFTTHIKHLQKYYTYVFITSMQPHYLHCFFL